MRKLFLCKCKNNDTDHSFVFIFCIVQSLYSYIIVRFSAFSTGCVGSDLLNLVENP